ncbi:hypothetical protein [Kaistella palustris]|uniref:hypothetical protein n=1 Tax=Kaistella palustris TaxID=493376 RepID=UPI00040A0856|nr:hypothetical protein [Kaistella palustris]
MKTKLLLPENLLYFLALFAAVFMVITVTVDVSYHNFPPYASHIITFFALFCSFIVAVVMIVDVFKDNYPGKYLWTLGFLFAGGITALFYLPNRRKYHAGL